MVPSDLLLQLITHLQNDISAVRGRRALLDYMRESTGARLGLLFIPDKGHQMLTLLEHRGRRPSRLSFPEPGSIRTLQQRKPYPRRIPLHGLFGLALHTPGLLYIPDAYSDPRSLPEERYWAWPGSQVVASAIATAGEPNNPQGVLVLCFDFQHKEWHSSSGQVVANEEYLLICISLLAAYLSGSDKDTHVPRHRVKSKSASIPGSYEQRQHQQNAPDEITRILSTLHQRRIAEQRDLLEQERSRIAREIHDGAAQQIAYVLHKLEFVQHTLEKEPQVALREIAQVCEILEESLNDLRHGISSLIPAQLEEQEFDAALQALLDHYTLNEPGLEIRYDTDHPNIVPPSLEAPLFRFIQETLNNVRKHAQASHVSIRIRTLSGLLLVQISDNGTGFSPEQMTRTAKTAQHLGLRIMRERIEQAGGNLEVRSKSGEGTTLKARFPLRTPAVMLTNREREVLGLLVEGATNRAIANKLSVSIETVKSHVHHIMQKMHVKDRTQAAVIATKQRWL